MKRITYIFAIGVLLSSIVSCDLNLTPKGTKTYEVGQQLIKNENDLKGFEANILASLRSLESDVYDWAPDVFVDYFNATQDFGNNGGPVHRGDETFTSGDYDSEAQWENPYLAIKNFNIFIDGSIQVPESLVAKTGVVRGEAFFGRAFAYLHMARIYGKSYGSASDTDLCVPIVVHYDQTARPARATVKEVYAQIKSDLDSAAFFLNGVAGAVRADKPTIDAVNALYARYYIDTKDYPNAEAKAKAVIESAAGYKLAANAEEFAAEWTDDNGNEAILQFYASLTEGRGYHYLYVGGNRGLQGDDAHPRYSQEYFIPTKKLVDSYEAADLRLGLWFNNGQNPDWGYYSFHNGTFYNAPGQADYYTFCKYLGNPALTTALPNTGHAVKVFLISEMYLIAAEAAAQNGGDALPYLNAIQTSRGASLTSGTLENVKKEWYRETVGEGLRFSCLKRWGEGYATRTAQAGAPITTGPQFEQKSMKADDYHWQWPVPAYEIKTNLNLVQNPGYTVE